MVHWTGQTNRWQTNDRGHSRSWEVRGGAILLLPWGLLILRWQLWTRYYHNMLCRMGKIQRAPTVLTSRSFPITSRGRAYNSCARVAMFHASESEGCFTDVSRGLQKNLAKIYNAGNHIYGENFMLKLWTCAQSHVKFQLEILIRSTIFAIHTFRENMLEISLNVSETHPWAPTLSDLHRLQCYNRAMIRWMCGVTTKDQVSSQDLFERMQFDDLAKVLLTRRLRWHGHIEHSDGLAEEVQKLNPIGGRGRHRPKKIWTEVIDVDRIALGLRPTYPTGKLGVINLEVLSDWTHPYTRY